LTIGCLQEIGRREAFVPRPRNGHTLLSLARLPLTCPGPKQGGRVVELLGERPRWPTPPSARSTARACLFLLCGAVPTSAGGRTPSGITGLGRRALVMWEQRAVCERRCGLPAHQDPRCCEGAWPCHRAPQRQAPSRPSVRREGPGSWRRFSESSQVQDGCVLQILDSEDAGISQSPGTCERQSSALPRLGGAPVLLERGRFGPARQVPPVNRLGCGFPSYSACRSAFRIQEILGLAIGAHISRGDLLEA
jgi:hypothetical protein